MNESEEPPGADEVGHDLVELKRDILEAIAAHLRLHGPKDWHLVRENPRFVRLIGNASGPSGARRFWRWRDAVGREFGEDRTRPREGREANDTHRAWAAEEVKKAATSMPSPPQPSFFMDRGAGGVETIRVFEAATEAWNDLLAAKALIQQSDLKPHVQAKLLSENARGRINAMHTLTAILGRIHDMDALHQRYQRLFQFVMEACTAHPDLQDQFLQLVEDLNSGAPVPTLPKE